MLESLNVDSRFKKVIVIRNTSNAQLQPRCL